MWTLQPEAEYEKAVRKWPPKHNRELVAVLDNYPDQTTQIIHVITIGDKNSQKADIKYSREFADDLSKTQEH